MSRRFGLPLMWAGIVALAPGSAAAFAGGTGTFQTDVAPYCAYCHSSRTADVLSGAGERADKEIAERKHIALILAGEKGYQNLSEEDRGSLVEQIRALDAASTVSMRAPAAVNPGDTFQVQVTVTGGAGPVVGVGLVDRAHRWFARPAASAGWAVVSAPEVIGSDGAQRSEWLERRPERAGRNISFVNVPGIESNSVLEQWDSAEVVFTLRAPDRPGTYPLAAAYFYGTEKATVLGYTTNAAGWKVPRGGMGGGSGRVLFTAVQQIDVK